MSTSSSISSNSFPVPILLLAWRRPTKTKLLISALRSIRPINLYLFCDGPSDDSDVLLVQQTRLTLQSEIDWPANVRTYYSHHNLGCRTGVSTAITWFFSHVSAGIILEDDCIPSPSFFLYCQELLDKYKVDQRIWCISGSNFLQGTMSIESSYYFSRYSHCWGWATWADRWSHYDSDLAAWPDLRNSPYFASQFKYPSEARYWSDIFDSLYFHSYPDSWAYRWFFTCLVNSGLTVLPRVNLVENIGSGNDATHTKNPSDLSSPALHLASPLQNPSVVMRHDLADAYTFFNHFRPKPSLTRRFYNRLLSLYKSVLTR